MKARWQALHPDHAEQTLGVVHGLFLRAPTVLGVVSTAQEHPKIPLWEQQLSAAAVCMNILYAATAMGLGCQWNTDWVTYDAEIYLGTPTAPLEDRPRPDAAALLTRWQPS